nr:uncharacterized protein LOC129524990 [Gorilla gorilla gorilla]
MAGGAAQAASPPRFPVGVRFPGGCGDGGRLGKRFRFKPGARVSAPDGGTSRRAGGQRAWAQPLDPARRDAARPGRMLAALPRQRRPPSPQPPPRPAPPRHRPFPLPWKQIGGRGEVRGGAAARGCGIAPGGRCSLGHWGRGRRRRELGFWRPFPTRPLPPPLPQAGRNGAQRGMREV